MLNLFRSLVLVSLLISVSACTVEKTEKIGTVKVDGVEFELRRVQDVDPYKRVVFEKFQVVVNGEALACSPPTVEECARVVRNTGVTDPPYDSHFNPPPQNGRPPIKDPRSIPVLIETSKGD
ncbi:MAG: hypothetical protein P1U83_06075 [Roseovarius sp.]|nr:hypothetical protein [Roseovarius sp.]